MKIPYHCPHCDQVSTRKWNLSTHIKRKHPGKDDPFYLPNKIALTDPYYQGKLPQTESSNTFLPQIDYSNPKQVLEKLGKYKYLADEIQKLSNYEVINLMSVIFNRPQLKTSNYQSQDP